MLSYDLIFDKLETSEYQLRSESVQLLGFVEFISLEIWKWTMNLVLNYNSQLASIMCLDHMAFIAFLFTRSH